MAEALAVSAVPAGPTPFVATTPLPPGVDEAALRAMANESARTGDDVVTIPATQTPPQVQANPLAPAVQATPADVPAKFLKPDGTVDVEKLQTSTKQLDEALNQKVLSIDEMVAQYREKEKAFRNLPSNPNQVAALAQQVIAQPVANPALTVPQPIQDPNVIYAQVKSAYDQDPIGTIVDIVKMVTQKETAPIQQFVQSAQEERHTQTVRQSISELARQDPRVMNQAVYQEIVKELDSDPGYWQLKRPHQAAWNEVKARLRLGDVNMPAQPSNTASPILGGGTPPPVPSSSSGITPQTMNAAITQAKPGNEMKAVEDELRRMAQGAQW